MTAPFPANASFEMWCATVNLYLEGYAGRSLADLPDLGNRLERWHAAGIPAQRVAEALRAWCPKTKATLVRFYTDQRPVEVLKQMQAKMNRGQLPRIHAATSPPT